MKELKAVEILSRIRKTPQDLFRYSDRDFDEALAELQALESYVVGQIGSLSANIESLSFSDKCIVEYQIKAYTDILQKIKGEKC